MTPSLHPSHWAAAATIAGTLILPGPTNTLLFLAGAKRGLRSSVGMVGAELAGYTIAILCWIGFLDLLASRFPVGPVIVRACAAGYLAYLAVTMLRSPAPVDGGLTAKGQRRRDLFCATLLNPKAFFFAAYVFPAASAGGEAILYRYVLFASLAVPIGYCWLTAGAALGASGTGKGARLRLFQRMAAVVLAVFSASLWVTVLR
jgi:threonine/homoserine/homoserine lactone efflux protein